MQNDYVKEVGIYYFLHHIFYIKNNILIYLFFKKNISLPREVNRLPMKNSKEVQNTRQTVCLDDPEKEVIKNGHERNISCG